ncbi:hypothetical protein LUZ60_005050 [Juncus effusus]|nr:hypothetical protein LUZ60_005050 [Juncus effusus]
MASLSKGCMKMEKYGKRLCELLKEQQEPFLLDEYLIQNGYKTRATKYSHQRNSIFSCCPSSNLSVCKRLLKRRSRSGGSALRLMLNKIMSQKVMKKVLNWGFSGRMDFKKLDEFFEGEIESELERINGEEEWRGMEESSRQHSPVSVFELHSDNEDSSSPIHDDNNFEYEKPSTSDKCGEDFDEMNWKPQEILRQKINDPNKKEEQVFLSWEKIARDISKIPDFVESDLTKSKREWCELNQDMKIIIGGEIERFIFEEMNKEAVFDLLSSHCTL